MGNNVQVGKAVLSPEIPSKCVFLIFLKPQGCHSKGAYLRFNEKLLLVKKDSCYLG